MRYSYTAKDKAGKIIRGAIEASNQKAVSSALHDQNLFPVNIKEEARGLILFQRKVSTKDKIIFTEQLQIMIKAGLPLATALESLRDETENKRFAKQINQIMADVEGGEPLSNALAKHPSTFSSIYVNMIRSGEKTGKLDTVLARLGEQTKKEYELNRKIRGALNYPIFVFVALICVMVLVLVYIIPQLKMIFDDAGVELPALTQAIIALSFFLIKDGPYIAAGLIALFFILARWKKTSMGRHFFDALIMRIPVIGTLLKKTYMSRFTRTFASLVASGLPLLDVFNVSGSVVGNIYYEEEIAKMSAKVKNGTAVSATLKGNKLFPSIVSQLAVVGEKSGSLDEVFNNMADFFDRDIDNITANLSSMLEPILMVLMGAGIGTVVISVLQPMYGLVNAV